jgi:alkanesulfonate monooxygenase SsuD/methylene tetrahydromethanopterin reductase-like flavin-dependent oxidoreductase (luciferase family)
MLPLFRDDPSEALTLAAEAERLGIDGVFVYDHLWPMGSPERPALAPFPVLGAVAAMTSRIWLGTLVARVGIVPDDLLVAQFAALRELAPGRVVAGLGTGDHLSFNENLAYGLPLGPAGERRRALGRCARTLLGSGFVVWVGGRSRRTIAVAEASGAVPNLWQASPAEVAAQAARSVVTWAGMARPGAGGLALDAAGLLEVAVPLAEAGASWLVFGWPVRLEQLAEAAAALSG